MCFKIFDLDAVFYTDILFHFLFQRQTSIFTYQGKLFSSFSEEAHAQIARGHWSRAKYFLLDIKRGSKFFFSILN